MRLYIKKDLQPNRELILEEERNYIVNTYRLKKGNLIRCFNEQNGEFESEIIDISKNHIKLQILSQIKQPLSAKEKGITIGICNIKSKRLEIAIEKACELGADQIYILQSDRSFERELNSARAYLILKQATQQCGRLDIPSLHYTTLNDFLNNKDLQIAVAHQDGENIKNVNLDKYNAGLIGPEGGFSDREIDLINNGKLMQVKLNENILRAETALSILCSSIL